MSLFSSYLACSPEILSVVFQRRKFETPARRRADSNQSFPRSCFLFDYYRDVDAKDNKGEECFSNKDLCFFGLDRKKKIFLIGKGSQS